MPVNKLSSYSFIDGNSHDFDEFSIEIKSKATLKLVGILFKMSSGHSWFWGFVTSVKFSFSAPASDRPFIYTMP